VNKACAALLVGRTVFVAEDVDVFQRTLVAVACDEHGDYVYLEGPRGAITADLDYVYETREAAESAAALLALEDD